MNVHVSEGSKVLLVVVGDLDLLIAPSSLLQVAAAYQKAKHLSLLRSDNSTLHLAGLVEHGQEHLACEVSAVVNAQDTLAPESLEMVGKPMAVIGVLMVCRRRHQLLEDGSPRHALVNAGLERTS